MISFPRGGYLARYFIDPLFRRQSISIDFADEDLLKRDKSPPDKEDKASLETVTKQNLDKLVEQSKEPLLKITTAIPLNPFPDKVIVDINKVTIIYRYFFWSEQIHSVFVKDISDVLVETSWFFSTLKIIDVGFTENSIDINYLNTDDAIKARKIIQGLIVVHKHGLDLSRYESADLSAQLEELGKAEYSI